MNEKLVEQILQQQRDCPYAMCNPGWQQGRAYVRRVLSLDSRYNTPEILQICDAIYLQHLHQNPVAYDENPASLISASLLCTPEGNYSTVYLSSVSLKPNGGLMPKQWQQPVREIPCNPFSQIYLQHEATADSKHYDLFKMFYAGLARIFKFACLSKSTQFESNLHTLHELFNPKWSEDKGTENELFFSRLARRAQWKAIAPAVQAFRAHLDPKIVHLQQRCGSSKPGNYSTELYEWLRCPDDAQMRERRQSFVGNWPSLYPGDVGSNLEYRDELAKRVDAQQPSVADLAKMLDVRPGPLKKLRGLSLFRMGADCTDSYHSQQPPCWARPEILARAVSAIPGGRRPDSRAGLVRLAGAYKAARELEAFSGLPAEKTLAEIWCSTTARRRDNPKLNTPVAQEFQRQIYRHLLYPLIMERAQTAGADWTKPPKDNDRLFCQNDFPQLFNMLGHIWRLHSSLGFMQRACAWENDANRIDSDILNLNHKVDWRHWRPLTEELVAPNGVKIAPLTSQQDLLREGDDRVMGNCVSSYTVDCLVRKLQVYHLSTPDDPWMATLGLSVKKEGCVEIFQNYAYANCVPSSAAREAAHWLVDGLNSGKIAADWHQAMHPDDVEMPDYNYDDPTQRQAVFELYRPYLPQMKNVATPQQWAEKTGIYPLIDRIIREPSQVAPL